MTAATKLATYEDVLRAPADKIAEVIRGVLHVQPRPALRHARATTKLTARLDDPFDRGRDGPGGWILLVEPELHLGADIVVPDIAGWRRERMPRVADAAYETLAPDWVCEVLSPSTERLDRGEKLELYAREGVPHVWLLNPITKTLEVLRLEAGRWMILGVHSGEQAVRAEPFDAIELVLVDLWVD